jgi:hypothetical protein
MAFGHHQKHGIAVMLGGLVLTAAVCAAPAAAQDEPKIEGNALELKWHASMGANSKSMSSCPAIGNLDAEPGLEICTASNGCGNADRYVCFDSNGKVMSDYKTDNGEARAPACIADVNGDGIEECIGGSACSAESASECGGSNARTARWSSPAPPVPRSARTTPAWKSSRWRTTASCTV